MWWDSSVRRTIRTNVKRERKASPSHLPLIIHYQLQPRAIPYEFILLYKHTSYGKHFSIVETIHIINNAARWNNECALDVMQSLYAAKLQETLLLWLTASTWFWTAKCQPASICGNSKGKRADACCSSIIYSFLQPSFAK